MIRTPLILVNFKTYDTVDGKKAVRLARICEEVALQEKVSIGVAVSALDLRAVVAAVKIPVFAQHVDDVEFGAHTGWIVPAAVKKLGAVGTLLNHAEHQLSFKQVADRVTRCKALGLRTCVCASSLAKTKQMLSLQPDFVAYEPPALIGGDISVSTAQASILQKVAKLDAGKTKVLCGAGVKTAQDVSLSLTYRMHGVLLASGVTKAKNPKKALLELVRGLTNTKN